MKIGLIERKLHELAKDWVGEKHLPSIIRQLNITFDRSILYFSSSRYQADYYKDHSVVVSGQYCPKVRDCIPENIIICLSVPKEPKKIVLTKKGARNLEIKILRTILHEYRHREQGRKQGFLPAKRYIPSKNAKNRIKMAYLGMPDEIDAHAHETIVENMFGLLDINRLRAAHKISWRESEAVFMYRQHFRKTDPKVWKKFLKKVYKNNEQHSHKRITNSGKGHPY